MEGLARGGRPSGEARAEGRGGRRRRRARLGAVQGGGAEPARREEEEAAAGCGQGGVEREERVSRRGVYSRRQREKMERERGWPAATWGNRGGGWLIFV